MTTYPGYALALKLGDGGFLEKFTLIGGLRTTRFEINAIPQESSNIAAGAWRTLVAGAGLRSVTIAGYGIFTAASYELAMRNLALTGAIRNYVLEFGNGGKLTGAFMISQYERTSEAKDVEVYYFTLESSGGKLAAHCLTTTFTNTKLLTKTHA